MKGVSEETASRAFSRLAFTEKPKCTIHIEWDDISCTFTELLQEILDRPDIWAESAREEFYHWYVTLTTALSQTELELLFGLVDASDIDREESDYLDGCPITKLCEGVCNRLVSKLLPFKLTSTRADDEGVWFIGEPDHNQYRIEGNEEHA